MPTAVRPRLTATRVGAPALLAAAALEAVAVGVPGGPAHSACRRAAAQARRAVGHLGGQSVPRARAVVAGLVDHLEQARRHAVAYGQLHRDPAMDQTPVGQQHTPRQALVATLIALADRIEKLADALAQMRIAPLVIAAATTVAALPEPGALPAATGPAGAPAGPDGFVVAVLAVLAAALVALGVWLAAALDPSDPARALAVHLATWSPS